ncbi:MAG TPA: MerR family transcriptional regulator [Mycobacteriales bacterium]|nr:MerR family transcriptional regulator [Mycobacteriales bacterium]
MTDIDAQAWRIGELAALTGLSVRTFHHYDQIGVLTPSARTTGGHRLYSRSDLGRLSLIVILRRAGLSLSEIKKTLDSEGARIDAAALISEQAAKLEAALVDTVAFGRRLQDEPLENLASEPDRVRALVGWVPQEHITVQPIVFLVYADVERAHRTLVEMFGFLPGPISRRPDGTSGYAEVSGPTGNIRLHGPRPGLKPPDPNAEPSSMTVVGVADIEDHIERASRAGAEIVKPVTTLFGMHEYTAFDHEHHFWCFQEPA